MRMVQLMAAGLLALGGCGSPTPSPQYIDAQVELDSNLSWTNHLAARSNGIHNKAEGQAIKGIVQVSRDGGGSWQDVKLGMLFEANSIVRSGPDSTIDVKLVEFGPMIRIAANSRVQLVRMDIENTGIEKVPDVMIDLQEGAILSGGQKTPAAAIYLVKTTGGVLKGLHRGLTSADGTVRNFSE